MRTKTRIILGLALATLGTAGLACSGGDASLPADAGIDASFLDVALPDVSLPETPPDASPEIADAGQGRPDGAVADAAPDAREPSDGGGFDAAPDCRGPAPALHPPGDASVFCPFAAPFGQPPLRCAATDECCETPPDAGVLSTCEAKGAACPVPGGTSWECQDPINCPSGQVCCAVGNDGGAVTLDPNGTCGHSILVGFQGTRCQAVCGAGTLPVCESQASCGAGTCRPLRARGVELGICL